MSREYRAYAKCLVCGDARMWTFSTKRDLHAFKVPDPYYCIIHDPTRLHGRERNDFIRSLIDVRFFDLDCFRQYGFWDETVNIILRVEINAKVVYDASGQHIQDDDYPRVYYTVRRGDEVWGGLEPFRKLRPVMQADLDEIDKICQRQIERYSDNWNVRHEITKYSLLPAKLKAEPALMILGGVA